MMPGEVVEAGRREAPRMTGIRVGGRGVWRWGRDDQSSGRLDDWIETRR